MSTTTDAAVGNAPAATESGPDRAQLDGTDQAPAASAGAGRPARARRAVAHPSSVAAGTWLITLPLALLAAERVQFDPFTNRGWNTPLLAGVAAATALLGLALRLRGEWIAGVAAGAWATWLGLCLRAALAGTPFGFGGLQGDAGRISAMATRYTVELGSADVFVRGVPSEYPPLFPWLIGRAAVLTDLPAWQLVGIAEALTMSAAALVGFVLWCRLVPVWPALLISALAVLAFGDPRKCYEVITVMVFVPWAIETFGRAPRARMHWLAAGALGGFIVVTYQGWFIFGLFGILGMTIWTLRTAPARGAYVRYVLAVTAVAAAVASWFLVPYALAVWSGGATNVADVFVPNGLHLSMLPFLSARLLSVVELLGLGGLLWLRRTAWWAPPLLWLVGGAFLYRMLAMVWFELAGRTLLLNYTVHLYEPVLAIAGVLTIFRLIPAAAKRFEITAPTGFAAIALTLAMLCTGYIYSAAWFPASRRGQGYTSADYTAQAHSEPLPTGRSPRFSRARTAPFPVAEIEREVESVLGPRPSRVTLSADERLFAILPWPGYVGVSESGAGSLVHFPRRVAELRKLAASSTSAAFAKASARTAYGPIDVFVLRRNGSVWMWKDLTFLPSQFGAESWHVRDDLPGNVVVAVRKQG